MASPLATLGRIIPAAILLAGPPLAAQPLGISLPAGTGDPVQLESGTTPATLLRLETSPDLSGWTEAGRFHDTLHPYADLGAGPARQRFYRLRRGPRTAEDDWKNQLWFPAEPFRSNGNVESIRWVKFALRPSEPWRVYFQDSVRYPFHYEFATQRLIPFQGLSRPAFDAVSLHRAGQQIVLGALLFPPRANLHEYAIQFAGLDPYTPDEIGAWSAAVKNAVHAEGGAGALYLPVFEQSETARREAAALAARGITVASVDRWVPSHHIYAAGWALGRLKFFPSSGINAAFTDGRLLPSDILLTDGIPAETPLVAGIISLTPATPNSHTAILSQSFGIPFIHLPGAADQARARELDGRKIILRAVLQNGEGAVKVIDVQDSLPNAVESVLLALKVPEPILYQPKQPYPTISANPEQLLPADIRCFGGKAVNYGLLRRTIPAHTPPAVAFSFNLWDAFMDQTLPGSGLTLRAEIASRLAPHQTWPPQIAPLKTTLEGIRDLIRRTARFTPAQQQSILDALADFTPARKIRFRSSTNVEDGETFTGAGLYDSYSGCLLDDLDSDATGPCQCEAAEPDERGVFRAIQRVYASFYNDNACLERLRHGVIEAEAAMGVLAHHSFPDEEELANGVATLAYRFNFFSSIEGQLVTQLGADPVTNPTNTSQPEIVEVYRSGAVNYLTFHQTSSRVPLGAQVMTWESDYQGFMNLFKSVGDVWRQLQPARTAFQLDFEYKKDLNLGLIVKQVREIPAPPTASTTAWLIDEPNLLVLAQRETGNVFGNHRLKSLWNLRSANGQLTAPFLASGLYVSGSLQHVENSSLQTLSGPLSGWPGASLSPSGTTHRWTTGSGPGLRHWQLDTTVTTSVTGAVPPLFTASDFPAALTVTYASPLPATTQTGDFSTTTSDTAVLEPPRALTPGSIPVERLLDNGQGIVVQTRFFWPDEPPTAGGYTAPLVKFDATTLTGLTAQPITLTGYFSQTYRPGHHNFTEDFIFEPALEPGVPPALLTELQSADIQYIHVRAGFGTPVVNAISPSGQMRRL